MSLERFAEIVEAAKQQEIEVDELKTTIEGLRYALKEIKSTKISVAKDTEVVRNNGKVYEDRVSPHEHTHIDRTRGFKYLTVHVHNPDKIAIVIPYINPVTGKQTTMGRFRVDLIDAVIARNEMAATLLKDGLIDFEKFLRITQG